MPLLPETSEPHTKKDKQEVKHSLHVHHLCTSLRRTPDVSTRVVLFSAAIAETCKSDAKKFISIQRLSKSDAKGDKGYRMAYSLRLAGV